MVHPPGAAQPRPHPDAVADDHRAGLRVRSPGCRSTSSPTSTSPTCGWRLFYPGAGPLDVEKAITSPSSGRCRPRRASTGWRPSRKPGHQSSVTAWFQYGTNLDTAQFEVQQRVAQILNTLPPGVGQPLTLKFDITNIPVVQVAVTGEGLDEKTALRSGPQHHRAAARAPARRGQRHPRRRQGARDCRCSSTPTRCAPAACRRSTWSTRCAAPTC